MLYVLVTGYRYWRDQDAIFDKLNEIRLDHDEMMVIQGGASGADEIANRWAKIHERPSLTWPAQWTRFGKPAGMKRNRLMADWVWQNFGMFHCVAFLHPKSVGTLGCINHVEKTLGIKVDIVNAVNPIR